MRAHTGVATVGGASKGSLVTLLCGLTGTKDTPTFNLPMTRRDYSDSTPFSSVVARHRLMDAAMSKVINSLVKFIWGFLSRVTLCRTTAANIA